VPPVLSSSRGSVSAQEPYLRDRLAKLIRPDYNLNRRWYWRQENKRLHGYCNVPLKNRTTYLRHDIQNRLNHPHHNNFFLWKNFFKYMTCQRANPTQTPKLINPIHKTFEFVASFLSLISASNFLNSNIVSCTSIKSASSLLKDFVNRNKLYDGVWIAPSIFGILNSFSYNST
jgi:hypothetical protein